MDSQKDLELVLRSSMPIVALETRDEQRVLQLLLDIAISRSSAEYVPLFRWTVTDGIQRLDIDLEPQLHNSGPAEALRHIRAVTKPGIYVLLDFHPYLQDPINVRLLKDICLHFKDVARRIVLISHKIAVPEELDGFTARFHLSPPNDSDRERIIKRVAAEYRASGRGAKVQVDPTAYGLLVRNLAGLTERDTEQLARNAIFQDGAITSSDLPEVRKAKYELLNKGGILHFEYDTARFSEIGGLKNLKRWLTLRKPVFSMTETPEHLDTPKGIMLIGVQGCGKSLAAKATAGVFELPLLRLDFASLYDKYHGETERNLRDSLRTAEVMEPCVLWIDEIEKGLAGRGGETGTTQRVLGSFLNWLAEKRSKVFVVATANDISMLPPELIRKGRFDEVFFVDLPGEDVRKSIADIHLRSRGQRPERLDLRRIATATDGFSGAEIEQALVASLYDAHAKGSTLDTQTVLDEIARTRPLSVVMKEQVNALRSWARDRTVSCD